MAKPTPIEGFLPQNSLTVGLEEILSQSTKPLPWVIKSILVADTLNLIYGPPKEFKTFVALDMALSQASGEPFLGEYEVLQPGLVIYIAGEGISGIGHRIKAWLSARNIEGASNATIPFRRTKGPIQITDLKSVQALSDEIEHIQRSMGVPVKGIYIDTLARNFGEGDENHTRDMGLFVQRCDYFLKQRFGAAVVIVHHTPVADSTRPRGAVALMGACDAMFKVTADYPKVKWEPQFMKDAEAPPPHVLEVERRPLGFTDQFGETVHSISLVMTDALPGPVSRITDDQKILLSSLGEDWKPYVVLRDDFMFEAAKVPAKKGKNKGKKRCNNTLRPALVRTLIATEEMGLIEVKRCNGGDIESVRLVGVSEVLQ